MLWIPTHISNMVHTLELSFVLPYKQMWTQMGIYQSYFLVHCIVLKSVVLCFVTQLF